MATNCDRRNPLTRSGTNQDARALRPLEPDFVRLDERSAADLIMFAQRFSKHLKYYDETNAVPMAGDWEPFFSGDISAILARISSLPVASFRSFFADLQEYLTNLAQPAADLRSHFKLAFHLPLLLLKSAGDGFARLPLGHPLRAFMQTVMTRDVEAPLRDLIGFYKGVLALAQPIFADGKPNLADYNTTFDDLNPRIQLPSTVSELLATAQAFSAFDVNPELIAKIAPTGWAAFYASVTADSNPYLDSVGDLHGQIFDALHYNLLADALERLFQAAGRLRSEAGSQLEASLTSDDGHTPHYGLWLAFLRLFAFSQSHLNGMTRRHLDYYYKDILRLCLRQPEPAKAHLLFELAKTVSEHLLPAGTLFRAGKDSAGREAVYRLDSDFVVNRANVEQLKSLFMPGPDTVDADYHLPYAATVTNSLDGQGAPLPKDHPQWKPFGPGNGPPNARIGFALADRQLFVRDGSRRIVITVVPEAPILVQQQLSVFKAFLTTAKGWLEIDRPPKLIGCTQPGVGIGFMIQLDGEDPPIVPYDPKVHGAGFSVTEPMVRIEFAFQHSPVAANVGRFGRRRRRPRAPGATEVFSLLRNTEIKTISLQVHAQDVHGFTLQNDLGPVDPGKPFLPFGPAPQPGASLILGSSELFSKRLERIALHVQWEKEINATGFFLKANPASYTVTAEHLSNSAWHTLQTALALFSTSGTGKVLCLTDLSGVRDTLPQSPKDQPYSGAAAAGFVRLVLQKDFGHARYPDQKTVALIVLAQGGTWAAPSDVNVDSSLPREPYTPKLVDFSVSYCTAAAKPARFFHLAPFGHVETDGNGSLFPRLANEGELYIGIRDLSPPQRVSLLFQSVPGTANPLKGQSPLRWHYLRGNEWVALAEQNVDDKTNDLTGSGILGLAAPADADTRHTLLPAGLHWFRMSAQSDVDAHNDLLLIAAQAATATFMDQGNAADFLATPLPAGTISKLKTGDQAIKKIVQPYPSFGGKPLETDPHFYTRASERLRHKDRGVTLWDYERLVLEQFPQVYLVKCVNHTELDRDSANTIVADNELKPGHVLVVTVPYVGADSAVDPLRPYSDKQTQVAIDRFLRRRISPFVQLEVQNAKIEEVQVKFRVAFTDEIKDVAFYKSELNDAIVRFLTPWAHAGGADISFGGKWHKSAIINFIEEQRYVDYVTDVEMYHRADIAEPNPTLVDEEMAQATTARSILVSHAAHIIEAIG
jgi:hypothetical protein